MANVSSYQLAQEAADFRCEAMMHLQENVWTRCGVQPVDVHHRLTRSKGGSILDDYSEHYHLMCLCRQHHKYAHESIDAYDVGLMIHGRVITENGIPKYVGPDAVLSERWG